MLNERWETISIDLIVELPELVGFDTVMIVVNFVSKRTHVILMYMTVTIEDAIRFLLHNVWKLHSLSTHVVLGRRLQFVTYFTKELYYLLGIKIASYIAWHFQSDRQIEHVNQELN